RHRAVLEGLTRRHPEGVRHGPGRRDDRGTTKGDRVERVEPRWGMTVPFAGVPLHEHRDWYRELVDLGYTDIWSAETDGPDGFTPLALAAAWAPELRLGTAIIPAFTRGPACLAQSVAGLAD